MKLDESSVTNFRDGSRLALKHRGSTTSQSTVNAPASTQGIIIDENERWVWRMFAIEGGSKMESHGCKAEERTKKTEYHSRRRSHRSGHKFEERLYASQSRSSVRCSPSCHRESDKHRRRYGLLPLARTPSPLHQIQQEMMEGR